MAGDTLKALSQLSSKVGKIVEVKRRNKKQTLLKEWLTIMNMVFQR